MSKIPAKTLAQIRDNNESLKKLDLRRKGLTVGDIRLLVDALQTNSYLTELDLSLNQLGDDSAKLLAATRIHDLNLNENSITDSGAKDLATNTHLSILEIANNDLSDEGAIALASNSHLKKLNLSRNCIGPKGAKALAGHTRLTHLLLDDNLIKDEGVIALASNQRFIVIGLGNTGMSDQGAKAFASHSNLTGIAIFQNSISEDVISQLEQTIARNTKDMKTKDLRFIREAITVIRGNRPGSTLSTLPMDLLLVILSYVGGTISRNPEQVNRVCQFLLETLRKTGKLEWQTQKGDTVFFKKWDEAELKEIEDHLKQPETKTEDQNPATPKK